jgi:tRNA A37 threonylcarbamoyladenosine modification protein TsaB
MFLFIDPSEKNHIRLALFDEDNFFEKKIEASNNKLLASIDAFFRERTFQKEALRGIVVVVGAGGFTSTRLATTIANTFGYVLRIPLLAISKEQATDVQTRIPELLEQPRGQYISATYSGEPNISRKKK